MIQTKEREKLGTLLALIFELQGETSFPNQKKRQEALEQLVLYVQKRGWDFNPDDPEFLPKLLIKILEESSQPIELPPGNLPSSELTEIYEKEKQEKEAQIQKAIASREAYQDYDNYINLFKEWVRKKNPQLPEELTRAIAEKSGRKAIASFEPIAQPNVLTPEDKNKILQQAEKIINEELKKVEFENKTIIQEAEKIVDKETQKIQEIIKNQSIKIAANPKIIRPLKEITRIITPPYQEILLPQNIIQKLGQVPEEVTFLPLYTLSHPLTLAAWIEKKIYTIPANLLKIAVEEATLEWQKMAQKGLFTEDYQASIKILRDWGLSINHPIIKKLEDKSERLKEQQKIIYEIKRGISSTQTWKDTAAAKILKHYYHFDKITGRQKIYDEDLKTNLPKLSPDLSWSQGGYTDFLRNTFNRFRFLVRGYEKISKFVTRGKYTSFLTPIRNFFSQKITQPAIKWLAKTAAGKAVKAGVKKAAGWLAIKLGVKAGVVAAGAATGPPGWVVAVVILAVDILKFLGKKIIGLIQKIIRDPEKAFLAVGSGILILFFIPMPLALIGVIPIIIGGAGLASFALAPITLGAISGGISSFFITLSGVSFAAPVALFIIILFAALVGLTLFIVMVVSGAFILPSKVAEITPTTISPYQSEYFDIIKTASIDKLSNNQVRNGEIIKYTITIRPKNGHILSVNNFEEKFNIFKEGASPDIDSSDCQFTPGEIQKVIDNKQSLECSINVDSRFENSAISNSITLKTSVKNNIGEQIPGIHIGMANAMVIIGTPPGDCPLIWPTYSGYITQGPESCYSHTGQEAIDIGVRAGTPVIATHKGVVATVACDPKGGGNYISIKGVCNGMDFYSYYFHLQNTSVYSGQTVFPGTQIATSGNTINCSGGTGAPHLHYEFKPFGSIKMVSPYVPRTAPRKCGSGYAACDPTRPLCNISW